MVVAGTLIEPLTESILLGVLASWSLHSLWALRPWVFLIPHFIAWLVIDLGVYASLAGHDVPVGKRRSFVFAWFLREALALPVQIDLDDS